MTCPPGYYPCAPCDSSGVVDCTHCRGHACGWCQGTGEETCESCKGLGSVPPHLVPRVCSGRVVEGREEPCGVVLAGPDPLDMPAGHPVSHGLCAECFTWTTRMGAA